MPEPAVEDPAQSLSVRIAQVAVPVLTLAALLPWVSPGVALLAGIAVTLTLGNPWPKRTTSIARSMLMWSVVGLGAGANLAVVARVGLRGIGYTAASIAVALAVGTLAGWALRTSRTVSLLISVGTAICGGSAIAAVSPIVRAKDEDVSMALVAVFLLNAIALWLFPVLGHQLNLSQDSFGLWCALAIHDTSSVVGAATQYGSRALEVATAAKLARALWIVPVSIGVSTIVARTTGERSKAVAIRVPWFIGGFVAVSAIVTLVPDLAGAGQLIATAARHVLSATLFLMGLGLSRSALRALGPRPLIQAIVLWLVVATTTLEAVIHGLI